MHEFNCVSVERIPSKRQRCTQRPRVVGKDTHCGQAGRWLMGLNDGNSVGAAGSLVRLAGINPSTQFYVSQEEKL